MKIEITVRPKEEKQEPINWRKLPKGTVIQFYDGVIGLVYCGDKDNKWKPQVLLLTYSDGTMYFDQAKGYESSRVVKVLGTLSEIVVE